MKQVCLRFMVSGVAFVSGVGIALAAPPPNVDLSVQMQAPATAAISTPATYSVSVKNLGPKTAMNTKVSVTLPLTNTSPSVYILGTVSNVDSKCSVVANALSCNLGSLKKNAVVSISYDYAAPVSTSSLEMTATATSDGNDTNGSNNTASVTPNLTYPSRVIAPGTTVENAHCTGRNLVSYFECLLFPSSISTHVTTFNSGSTISFTEPGYTGNWSQPTSHQLFFEYFDSGNKVAEFNGYAINGSNCFDGMTVFFPASPYISPYRVCLQ